jgi:mannose-6-phosphate isomerase-like protein (cupin superfamily)
VGVPIVRRPGEGRSYPLGDNTSIIKFGDAETESVFGCGEFIIGAGHRAPLHTHARTTEVGYILEGDLDLYLDGETLTVGAGTFFMTPPGVIHAYYNPGAHPVRLVTFASPGGEEQYWIETSRILSAPKLDGEALGKVFRAQDIEILGPWVPST